jgi:hypothetical protein
MPAAAAVDTARFQHEWQSRHGAIMRGRRCVPPPPGMSPTLGLRKADAERWIVGDQPAMAGERQFQPAAQRRAVESGDNRLSAGLHLRKVRCRVIMASNNAWPPPPTLPGIGAHLVEIRAGAEIAWLGARDDEALDRRVRADRVGNLSKLATRRHGEHVHRFVRRIPCERDDACRRPAPI